ncbi:MAG: heavy metal-associated domain-containing protein [Desulfococcaceae bacterium]|jgi:copper chaperone CopZ|nr:heavy metal-associated domain-containing protein [Desulfococcaceae bacterium]
METKIFTIPRISCAHCCNAIEKELGELPGVKSVESDAVAKTVCVSWEKPANPEKITELLKEIHYPPSD